MPMPKPKTAPSDLRVTRLPLADLTPYPHNPRHITPAAVNAVAESLAAFGWQQPIVIDPKKVIVAGHTRCLAALQLGWTHAPTVQIAAKHAKAYRLADNRSGEFSTWDLDVLGGELAALPSGQLEALPALDFSALALPPLDGKTDPDDIPEAPEPRTKRGDVWMLGDHRLMCGDATDSEDVARLIDGGKPSMVITSPPYNLMNTTGSFPTGKTALWKAAKIKHGYQGHSDNMPHEKYVEWQRECLTLMMESIADDGAIFYNHKWRVQNGLLQDRADIMDGFPLRQIIIWDRGSSHNFNRRFFLQTFEVVYLIAKPDFKLAPKASHATAVWRIGFEQGADHPAPFPVAFAERCIQSVKSGPVLDPFCGSGTTIIAAERLKRRCYAMEIAPEYCDLAVARWEAFTGRTATR